MKPKFHLEVSYNDASGEPVAAYLRVREGVVAATREVSEGVAFADYTEDGTLLGIELLGPCEMSVLDRVSEKESDTVRHFLNRGVRNTLICN